MDLKQLLKTVGKTQREVAEALRVSEPTVSRWAANGVPAERVADVARATGLAPALLRPDLAAAFGSTTEAA